MFRIIVAAALLCAPSVAYAESIEVRINDRGPFIRGRGIDLSYGAAKALGMSGTARVSVSNAHTHSC